MNDWKMLNLVKLSQVFKVFVGVSPRSWLNSVPERAISLLEYIEFNLYLKNVLSTNTEQKFIGR